MLPFIPLKLDLRGKSEIIYRYKLIGTGLRTDCKYLIKFDCNTLSCKLLTISINFNNILMFIYFFTLIHSKLMLIFRK